jgi:hypothetical protein
MFGLTVDGAAGADPGADEDSAPVDGEGLGVGALVTGGSGSPFDPGNCSVGLSLGAETEGAGAGPVVGPDPDLARAGGDWPGAGLWSVVEGVAAGAGPVVGTAPGAGLTSVAGAGVPLGVGAAFESLSVGGASGVGLMSVVEGVAVVGAGVGAVCA